MYTAPKPETVSAFVRRNDRSEWKFLFTGSPRECAAIVTRFQAAYPEWRQSYVGPNYPAVPATKAKAKKSGRGNKFPRRNV